MGQEGRGAPAAAAHAVPDTHATSTRGPGTTGATSASVVALTLQCSLARPKRLAAESFSLRNTAAVDGVESAG
jgi:hypothetical protein